MCHGNSAAQAGRRTRLAQLHQAQLRSGVTISPSLRTIYIVATQQQQLGPQLTITLTQELLYTVHVRKWFYSMVVTPYNNLYQVFIFSSTQPWLIQLWIYRALPLHKENFFFFIFFPYPAVLVLVNISKAYDSGTFKLPHGINQCY